MSESWSTRLALELSRLVEPNIDSCVDVDDVLLSVESSFCNNMFRCKLFRLDSIVFVFVFVLCLARPDLDNLSSPVLCDGEVCFRSVGEFIVRRNVVRGNVKERLTHMCETDQGVHIYSVTVPTSESQDCAPILRSYGEASTIEMGNHRYLHSGRLAVRVQYRRPQISGGGSSASWRSIYTNQY